MELRDAISLIQTDEIIHKRQTRWADLGCGSGLFTRALANILHTGSSIYAVDKSISSFQKNSITSEIMVKTLECDFVRDDLTLQGLDGILMANSLHFVRDKKQFIEKVCPLFGSTPVFLMVEYDTDMPNPWVPYPLSFGTLKKLLTELGFKMVRKINEKKSLYHSGKIYSAFITR